MRPTLLDAFLLASMLGGLPAPVQEPTKVPDDSLQLVVTGCLKGRVLSASKIRRVDSDAELDVPVSKFRLEGKKDLMAEVKRQDGRRVRVNGLVRKTDLREPGIRVGKGRIVIGGGTMDPGRPRPTMPVERLATMDTIGVEPLPEPCLSAGR